jgi:hypothetical protein
MTSDKSQDVNNEAQIRALIERWADSERVAVDEYLKAKYGIR